MKLTKNLLLLLLVLSVTALFAGCGAAPVSKPPPKGVELGVNPDGSIPPPLGVGDDSAASGEEGGGEEGGDETVDDGAADSGTEPADETGDAPGDGVTE